VPGLTDPAALRAALPDLFAPVAGERSIGLAVSGGPDSLALLVLAAEWARGLAEPTRLVAYSLDHGLRPEAGAEVAMVEREAARLGVSARGLRWTGPKPVAGRQAAARVARYRLIGEAMRADGASVLLTGHHQDDQAETVLMRLAHGSGLAGLGGMEPFAEIEGVRVFRPLLAVPRQALAAVVAEAGLTPATDPSNADPHYERARWREAGPQLAALGLDGAAVARFARRAGEADEALAAWAGMALAELAVFDGLGAAQLPAAGLPGLPRAVGVRLVAALLAAVGGGQRPHALGAIERLHDRLVADHRFAGATVSGVTVRRRGEALWFAREPGRRPLPAAELGPGAALLWDGRFRIANAGDRPARVTMAGLSRAEAERLVGMRLSAPAAALRGAPLVAAADGAVLAFGTHTLDQAIAVEFVAARSIFAPSEQINTFQRKRLVLPEKGWQVPPL
jgi:tRNA(Ile)-lysidine synthase